MASIWNYIHILILSLLLLAYSGKMEKRFGQSSQSSVCDRIYNFNQVADRKILQFMGEVEKMRTGCLCGLNKQIDEKLAVLKNDLADLRDGCLCEPSECEDGWSEFEGSCFLYQTETVNWYQAKETCNEYGGRLAEVDSNTKQEFLVDLVKKGGAERKHVWIGATDAEIEGKWKWSGSGTDVKYTKWSVHEPEPNGGSNENCVALWWNFNFDWNDFVCSSNSWKSTKLTFLCEKQL